MPVKTDAINFEPPPPANSFQPGVNRSLLYNGSRFQGHQKSKGKSYEVEVILQVRNIFILITFIFNLESKLYTNKFSINS